MSKENKAVILVVEDDAPQRRTLAGFLKKKGYYAAEAENADAAAAIAKEMKIDLLLTDLRLGGKDGITLLKELKESNPQLQAVVMTAYGAVDDAVKAMKNGALDFLQKPLDLDLLEAILAKAAERSDLAKENAGLAQALANSEPFAAFVGDDPKILEIKKTAAKAAVSRATIMILGESGSGKEALARAIHSASNRRDKPFITVNCAAFNETLIESELFGHEKGAFTGADKIKKGRFELADGGTLFIDEVGDIPLPFQVKLLGAVQTGAFERVGGTETIKTDIRIIAATHRDLKERVRSGLFREDLYWRLNVVTIEIPPLRERPGDIPLLVERFVKKSSSLAGNRVKGITPEAARALAKRKFGGNVRELENMIERAVALCDGETLTEADFPEEEDFFDKQAFDAGRPRASEMSDGLDDAVERLERKLIADALAQTGGNQSAAARLLRVTERAVRYKVKKYGL